MPRNDYEIMLHMKMLDEGIVPYGVVPAHIREQLEEVSAQDRRRMKRKFRKLWRKAYKKLGIKVGQKNGAPPNRNEMSKRLVMVYNLLREDILNDMQDDSQEHIYDHRI